MKPIVVVKGARAVEELSNLEARLRLAYHHNDRLKAQLEECLKALDNYCDIIAQLERHIIELTTLRMN